MTNKQTFKRSQLFHFICASEAALNRCVSRLDIFPRESIFVLVFRRQEINIIAWVFLGLLYFYANKG